MTAYSFSQRSKDRMQGVHPDIVDVMELALSRSHIDFTVLEGLRSPARQKELYDSGASKTMNSRHLTGHAIDIAPIANGQVTWDWPVYHELAPVVKKAAADLGVDLEWGGDWASFPDGPHWQLSWNTYSKTDMEPKARTAIPLQPDMSEPPKRNSIAQSTTVQATVATGTAAATGIVTVLGKLDPVAQYIVLACGGVMMIGLGWILRERIRKWVDGDR